MDPIGIKETEKSAATDLNALLTRVEALEARGAADVQAIAKQVTDGLAETLKPIVEKFGTAVDAVNQMTITIGVSVNEVTSLARRLDGASIQVKLGPEIAYPAPQVKVTEG